MNFSESILNTKINRTTRNSSSICQECFEKLERYENLQREAENIQKNLLELFHSENLSVEVKKESEEFEIQPAKCLKNSFSPFEFNNHTNCVPSEDEEEEEMKPEIEEFNYETILDTSDQREERKEAKRKEKKFAGFDGRN